MEVSSNEVYLHLLDNLIRTVREMLSDDELPVTEVRLFMESQMFKELCPELAGDYEKVRTYEQKYISKSKSSTEMGERSAESGGYSSMKKKEYYHERDYHERGKSKERRHYESSKTGSHHSGQERDNEKYRAHSQSRSHHQEESKHKYEDRTKSKFEPTDKQQPKFKVIQMTSSSEVDSDEISGKDSKKKKLHKIRSSRSASSERKHKQHDTASLNREQDHQVKKKGHDGTDNKSTSQGDGIKSEQGPKVHPFWLGKSGPVLEVKGKLFNTEQESASGQKDRDRQREKERERERERQRQREKEKRKRIQEEIRRRREKERERRLKELKTKPFSYYDRWQAKTKVQESTWKPLQEPEYKSLEKEFNLKPVSVVCVDLSNLKKYFHTSSQPPPPSSCASSILLKKNNIMVIPDSKGEEIEKTEKTKRESFVPVLNKWFTTNVVKRKRKAGGNSDSDSDYDRAHQSKKKFNKNKAVESSSDSSDPVNPVKGNNDSRREKINLNARKGTAEYKAELRRRQLEIIRQKAEKKIAEKGTRKLPWESTEYFEKGKKSGLAAANIASKKENALLNKDKPGGRMPERLSFVKKPHAPALPFQKILASIDAANKEASKKPLVHLRIPKLSEKPNVNTTEYTRPNRVISPGEVANEVGKLLFSTSKVEMPLMPTNHADLADYTVRKIAWWFLKSEQEPADVVALHPELHDDELFEDWFDPNAVKESDDDSSIGCVSDPEGNDKVDPEVIKKKALDPDWADEYCGLTTLEARFRKPTPGDDRDKDFMKGFFKIRPGTNYEKPNFEVKCFLCNEKIFGQRAFGAHIRSANHKNTFRNHSLQMANYDEFRRPGEYKKVFTAKLVTYAIDTQTQVENEGDDDQNKYRSCKLEMEKGDSPRAVIDGEDNSPDLLVQQIPEDELSLPSISKFDLDVDECQKEAKITLRTNNLWTGEMEERWVKATELEARLTNEYNDIREKYINDPASHPLMENEWKKFYSDRCAQIEDEGKNPDDYNFASEWMPFWLKRMQEIMKTEVDDKISQMKKRYGVDFESLNRILKFNNIEIKVESAPRTPITKLSSKSSGRTQTKQSNPESKHSKQESEHSKPESKHPKPVSKHPKPESKHSKQESEHSKPESKHPKPVSKHPKPESKHSKPESKHWNPERKHWNTDRKPWNPDRKHWNQDRKHSHPGKKHWNSDRKHSNPETKHWNSDRKHLNPDRNNSNPDRKHLNPDRNHTNPETKHSKLVDNHPIGHRLLHLASVPSVDKNNEIRRLPEAKSYNAQPVINSTSSKTDGSSSMNRQVETSNDITTKNLGKPVIDKDRRDVSSVSSTESGEIDSMSDFGMDQHKLTSFIHQEPNSEVRKSIDELIRNQI